MYGDDDASMLPWSGASPIITAVNSSASPQYVQCGGGAMPSTSEAPTTTLNVHVELANA